ADGLFAAGLAARSGRIIADGQTPKFLADFDIAAIGSGHTAGPSSGRGRPTTSQAVIGQAAPGRTATSRRADNNGVASPDAPVDLLRRLGIRPLGEFAALPAADVLARFGFDAALVHRLAAGLDERPLAVRQPPTDLDVTERFEEPI